MADAQSNAALPAYPMPDDAPRSGVLHVRHRHTDRFTVIGNHLAQHERLSAVAIGLAVYIQSLPDGAPVTVKALALRFPEGEITVRRAMNELEAEGYVERRRIALGGGRFSTRTFAYDRPGRGDPAPGPAPRPEARPTPVAHREHAPAAPASPVPARQRDPGPVRPSPVRPAPALPVPSVPAPSGPAADLLARLRLADPRLLLSTRDIARLAPAVDVWLGRAATSAQITRTLSAGLPPEPILHPARFLEHRLTVLLPPPLPASPPTQARPAPLHTCDGCDRAFRTYDPTALCADCRGASAAA
jgi:hypothetical protein